MNACFLVHSWPRHTVSFKIKHTIESMVYCSHLPKLVRAGLLWRISRGIGTSQRRRNILEWINIFNNLQYGTRVSFPKMPVDVWSRYRIVNVKCKESLCAYLPNFVLLFSSTLLWNSPWTPEIFIECYCVARNKRISWEITKPQTATVISLWFWCLLAYPELHCDWPVHNQHSRRFQVFTVFWVWQ